MNEDNHVLTIKLLLIFFVYLIIPYLEISEFFTFLEAITEDRYLL